MPADKEQPSNQEIFDSIIAGNYSGDERARLAVEANRTPEEVRADEVLAQQYELSQISSEHLRSRRQHKGLGRLGLKGFINKLIRRN